MRTSTGCSTRPRPSAPGARRERWPGSRRRRTRAAAAGADLRLRRLAASFELDSVDVELLLVALAPDLDARFERLYGYLHDDVSRRRASVGLALELAGARSRSCRRAAPADRRCRSSTGGLVVVEDAERPFLHARVARARPGRDAPARGRPRRPAPSPCPCDPSIRAVAAIRPRSPGCWIAGATLVHVREPGDVGRAVARRRRARTIGLAPCLRSTSRPCSPGDDVGGAHAARAARGAAARRRARRRTRSSGSRSSIGPRCGRSPTRAGRSS